MFVQQVPLHLKGFGLKNQYFYINLFDLGLSVQLQRNGMREIVNSYYLAQLVRTLQPNFDVLDIGGNIGYFPLIEAKSSKVKNRIFVYEPVNETFEVLKLNMKDFDNVHLFRNAVGSIHAETFINVANCFNVSSINPIDTEKYPVCTYTHKQKVCMLSLNEVCDPLKPDVLLRCDIEGYETELFKDIPSNVKLISFELHTPYLGDLTAYRLIKDLQHKGFRVFLALRDLAIFTAFKQLGHHAFSLWELVKDKRIFHNPTDRDLKKILSYSLECPHLFLSRQIETLPSPFLT